MGRKSKAYAPEFRQRMIELVAAGRTPEELAREFEPSAQAIRNWVAQAQRDAGKRGDGLTSGSGHLCATAIFSAASTTSVCKVVDIDQPTIRRLNTSRTIAR